MYMYVQNVFRQKMMEKDKIKCALLALNFYEMWIFQQKFTKKMAKMIYKKELSLWLKNPYFLKNNFLPG